MKLISKIVILIPLIGLLACKQPVATSEILVTPNIENNMQPVLKTPLGNFVIVSARFVDEVHGTKPGPGEKILLLILSQPGLERLDPAVFSLEAFDKMTHDISKDPIYILGDDGSKTISTMGGWVDEEFAVGFKVPAAATTYTLFWPDNSPMELLVK